MIIEFEPGDTAEITEGHFAEETVTVTEGVNDGGYYRVACSDGSERDVYAGILAPVWEVQVTPEDTDTETETDTDTVPPFGMSSAQITQYTEKFLHGCMARIGNEEQNTSAYQKFETMSPLEILDAVEGEVMDIPNYCAFLYILIQRMKNGIGEAALG